MLDSGFARVVAVGVGIGAGLLVPWLRHHNDVDRTPDVYVDEPSVRPVVEAAPDVPQAAAEIPAPSYEDEASLGRVHLKMNTRGFGDPDRLPNELVYSTDTTSLVMSEQTEIKTWTQTDIDAYVRGVGLVFPEVWEQRSDGSMHFTSSWEDTKIYGWFATKKCGTHQIAAVVTSTERREVDKLGVAFRAARCTKF
ncbi:MAG TPA: hypothetical protein VGM90_15135 [Kofleriaceae bacterium]|jgi:hypothetical protein